MRFREILVRSHAVDAAVLAQAEQVAAQTQAPLVHVLVRYQVVDGNKLARLLARALHVNFIDVGGIDVHPGLLQVIPRYAAERLRILPIGVTQAPAGERLFLAMADPSDDDTIAIVEKATGRTIEPLACDDDALSRSFDRHYAVAVVGEDVDAPVLVGQLAEGAEGSELLTESTAEALRFARSPQAPRLELDGPTLDLRRRPASVSLAALTEATADTLAPQRGRTLPEVRGARSQDTSAALSELGIEPPSVVGRGAASSSVLLTALRDDALYGETVEVEGVRSLNRPPPSRVTLALPAELAPDERATLMSELVDLLGPVDVDIDAMAACRAARGARALVLMAPRNHPTLLAALLDLNEDEHRPCIIVLGGDLELRLLDFVDQHAELPDGARAIALAVTVALRQVGIRL